MFDRDSSKINYILLMLPSYYEKVTGASPSMFIMDGWRKMGLQRLEIELNKYKGLYEKKINI